LHNTVLVAVGNLLSCKQLAPCKQPLLGMLPLEFEALLEECSLWTAAQAKNSALHNFQKQLTAAWARQLE
jgi:hypothetical protein